MTEAPRTARDTINDLPELSEEQVHFAELRDAAPAQVQALLAERVPSLTPEEIDSLNIDEHKERINNKIAALEELKKMYDVTKEGSTIPLNNKDRFLVREILFQLVLAQGERELIQDMEAIAQRADKRELESLLKAVFDEHFPKSS